MVIIQRGSHCTPLLRHASRLNFMRLKKIEVNGFKSFADRQTVVFDERVTAVIGPNGCGKSNIVDAVRWCLGEQRAKHLRGSGMGDVIFGGTATRGGAGLSEVTITFENEGDVAAPYTNHAEVAVTRRLFRDGTSEYLINKVPCRLRDINDMLVGTGIGKSGYSIIEQGRVSQIVTSKPEHRRHIIDEAAGITKFKLQKAAAERKIGQTQQNLLRVTDVIAELESRLAVLKRQAQKAERYRRYKNELTDLELWAASHKFLELKTMANVLTLRSADLHEEVDNLRAEVSVRDARVETMRLELSTRERELSQQQEQLFGLENKISLNEQDRNFQRQERAQLESSIEQSAAEIDVGQRAVESLEAELASVDDQSAGLGDGHGDDSEVAIVERLTAQYDELRTSLEQLSEGLEQTRRDVSAVEASVVGAEARLTGRHAAVEALSERVAENTREREELGRERDGARAELTSAEESLVTREAALVTVREQRGALDRERVTLRDEVRSAEVGVETARQELVRARSRLTSLEEIQQRYRGCASGVQVVMEHREELAAGAAMELGAGAPPQRSTPAVYGIMADYVTAPAHLESAVSAVLGDRLQGIVVDDPNVGAGGVALLKQLKEGRSTFLPREVASATPAEDSSGAAGWRSPHAAGAAGAGIEVVDLTGRGVTEADPAPTNAPSVMEEDGVLGSLVDLVELDEKATGIGRMLLGDAIVVDGLPRALELWGRGGLTRTLVTLEGDRLEPSGIVVGGSSEALDSALLQQKREIGDLEGVVTQLEEELRVAKQRHQGFAERLADVERAREASEVELLELEKQRLGAVQRRDTLRERAERSSGDLSRRSAQGEQLATELTEATAQVESLTGELADARARLPQLREELVDSAERKRAAEARRESVQGELSEARVALARWQQDRAALANTRERLQRQVSAERERARRLSESVTGWRVRIDEIDASVVTSAQEHRDMVQAHKVAADGKITAQEACDETRNSVAEVEVTLKNLRGSLDTQRDALAEVELGLRELDLERSHLTEDISHRYDRRLEETLLDYHARGVAGAAESKQVVQLKRILGRMGEVNLTAIREFDEVSERFEYLTSQRADLEDAIAQLEEAIERINKTTRERFKTTFEQVNERFKEVFPRLFSGGRAELVMTDPTDLLATGVEIFAQPPGKKIVSLELLSGGEKALTAVSLIFAIFLNKPSPFCLLDEVDAPLDEANVGRFCDLVRELSVQTQFIIITHNKRTMETADRLYGVTMQQRGVSKLVSVNLRRSVESAQLN